MQSCKCCKQNQDKLKVLKSDFQFQLKKITEDISNEKVLLEQQYQKDTKRVIDKYNKEKRQRQQQNRRWISKYDKTVEQYTSKLKVTEQSYSSQLIQKEVILRQQHLKKEALIIQKYNRMMKAKEQCYNREINMLQIKIIEQKKGLQDEYRQKMNRIDISHKQQTSNIIKGFNERILKLKQQNKDLSQINAKIKLQSSYKQTQLYQEIYQHKQTISCLKYQIDKVNKNIHGLQIEIKQKEEQINLKQKEYKQMVLTITKEYQQSNKIILDQCRAELQSLLKSTLNDCQRYQFVLKNIEEKRENQIKIYEDKLSIIKCIIQERPSREEDLHQINTLKQLLDEKQKQFQKAVHEIKNYKLELNNKEEVYNRIFNSHPLNIEKIGKKKQIKVSRGSISATKEAVKYGTMTNLYSLTNTTNTLGHTQQSTNTNIDMFGKKDRLILQPKSHKLF